MRRNALNIKLRQNKARLTRIKMSQDSPGWRDLTLGQKSLVVLVWYVFIMVLVRVLF